MEDLSENKENSVEFFHVKHEDKIFTHSVTALPKVKTCRVTMLSHCDYISLTL